MNSKSFSNHIQLNNVKINDDFWNEKMELVRTEVIPYQYEALNDRIEGAEKSYCLENFAKASKIAKAVKAGEEVPTYPADRWQYTDDNCPKDAFHGWVFQDSDIYKWIEAVGYSLANHPDAQLHLRAEEFIDLICSAQLENGYLDTLYIINNRNKIFTNLNDYHELYCFGHMTEAAIAFYNATGNKKLLDSACRFADLICDTFNENGKKGYPGHEIAEMALVKLYDATNCKKYFDTACFFIEERGKKPYYFDIEKGKTTVADNYHYNQAHCQPKHQHEAVGHAVRGVYLYSAMADISKRNSDTELYSACCDIWNNIENKKMYITGGIGSTVDGEAFSFDYDLPNDLAYCETCASIGLMFFARRMLEISPNSHYADVMERALYNTVLSGMALDGKSFFYVNPLEVLPEASNKDSRKRHVKAQRQKWFGCACCPPNLARLVSSIGEYCYTENDDTLFVHQYIGGTAKFANGVVDVSSTYAVDGRVNIKISANKNMLLALRIPYWCNGAKFSAPCVVKDGYAYFDVNGEADIVAEFGSTPKLVKCSNLVHANVGKVAVTKGPFVYCAEEVDNGKNLQMLKIDKNTDFSVDENRIVVNGFREQSDTSLYADYADADCVPCKITLVPYYRWGNRGENEMTVYLRI